VSKKKKMSISPSHTQLVFAFSIVAQTMPLKSSRLIPTASGLA